MIDKLPSPKQKSKKVRAGRGIGTGKGGHTTGKGMKGQKSRSGYKSPRKGFEGGQMPLSRRLPTLRGLSSKSRGRGFIETKYTHFTLKLSEVAESVKSGKITKESLSEMGLISEKTRKATVKIVFDKEITKKVTVEGVPVSKTAKAAIEKAGGKVS